MGCILWGAAGTARASPETITPSPVVQQALQAPHLAGQGQMRFLGLRIYDARLWVEPAFNATTFARQPLVLELMYHRAFSGPSIAQRSIQEIERQRRLEPALAQRWTTALSQWLPDVQAGDTLTGWYLPGQGMRLWRGEQALGTLDDPELAQLFFGIWLSAQTSEPHLRSALLAHLPQASHE